MKFVFNERKAAEVAAYLLGRAGGKLDVYYLTKLMYLADRRSLLETGLSITGDEMTGMPLGPVLSKSYDRSKQAEASDTPWFAYMGVRDGNAISLRRSGQRLRALSRYDRRVLDAVFSDYGHMTFGQLKKVVHGLPEWEDPDGSSYRIDPADVLRLGGWPEEHIQLAIERAREVEAIDRLLPV